MDHSGMLVMLPFDLRVSQDAPDNLGAISAVLKNYPFQTPRTIGKE